ncbi:MAG: hypothetical protein R3C39_08000 [Dehalococcoidia bacterium]
MLAVTALGIVLSPMACSDTPTEQRTREAVVSSGGDSPLPSVTSAATAVTTRTVAPTPQRPEPPQADGTLADAIVALASAWTGLDDEAFEVASVEEFDADDSCLGAEALWLSCVAGTSVAIRVRVRAGGVVEYQFHLDEGGSTAVWVPGATIEGRVEDVSDDGLVRLSGSGDVFAKTIEPGFIQGQIVPGTVIPDGSALTPGTLVTAGIAGKPNSDVTLLVGIVATPPSRPVPLHDRGTRTGIDSVDEVIDAVLSGDIDALVDRASMINAPCVSDVVSEEEMHLPRCGASESIGSRHEVFPYGHCDGHLISDPRALLTDAVREIEGLYAVVRIDQEDGLDPLKNFVDGDVRVVFASSPSAPTRTARGYAFGLSEDGAIVSARWGCHTPESLASGPGVAEPILAPLR